MNSTTAIQVEDISKVYRIGLKDELRDNFLTSFLDFVRSPINNYRKYRSLYKFDDIVDPDHSDESVLWALQNVSFKVEMGEALGIIGRNGAGKSTLLKILAKITTPTKGKAEIRGRISSLLEVGTGFHPELTGRENIYLNGTILGMKTKEVNQKFDEIVDFSGVEKFLDTPVKRYSSGMKVRLAFSVAAHLEPEILIIDEVLAVGDADFQKKCLDKMENVGQRGRTVLFVSHNMAAISRLCQRAIYLEEGRIVNDGRAQDVVASYLLSDSGTTAAREWSDPEKSPGGPFARLRTTRICNKAGEISEVIDIRDPVFMEMEFEVLEANHLLQPQFVIRNDFGQIVFVSIDQDLSWREKHRPPGRHRCRATIPGNFLSEGLLHVTCALLSLNPDTVQFVERDTIAFTVVDSLDGNSARGNYARNIPGIVRPLLKWETKIISEHIE